MKPRIVLGIPHVGDFPGYFSDSLFFMAKPEGTSIIRVPNKAVDLARNMIVEGAMKNPDVTHVFFMDSDMIFPGDALMRLLQRDLPIVGGTYFARTDTPIPHIYDFSREDELGRRWYTSLGKEVAEFLKRHPERQMQGQACILPITPDSLLKCQAIATGCLLVKREVFEAMSYPWFKCWPETAAGEDFYFCDRARELGFQPYADLTVQCGHEARPVFVSSTDFEEVFGIGTPDEYDFASPIWVEAGPRGRRVKLDVKPSKFVFPADVEGYTNEDGGRFLFDLAIKVDERGLIVELGSYKGRSTICLAQAGRQVWTVDHFMGELIAGLDDKEAALPDHVSGIYRSDLADNLIKAGVADHVRVIDRPTSIAPDLVEPSIDLLFVDAAHDYESVTADLAAWEPFVRDDGVIVFDDANFPGVAKAMADAGQRGWRAIGAAAHMIAVRREGKV